jgi:hypothetical protein
MPVTLIGSDWSAGSLIFFRKDTGATVMTIAPTGVTLAAPISNTVAALTVGDGYSGMRSVVTAAAAANAYGTAGYFETTLTGTVAGTVYGFGSWINMAASSVGGSNLICAQDNGIYVETTGTPMSAATAIIGMRMEYVAAGGEDPGALYLFSTNIYANALTAMFHVNAKADLTWVTGAKSGGVANIPLFRDVSAGATWYVNIYSS